MKRSRLMWSLQPVYSCDTWQYFHGASREHSYATATVCDLLKSVARKEVSLVELVHIYHHRRLLCRGCSGVDKPNGSPLALFPPDEVIGFVKSSKELARDACMNKSAIVGSYANAVNRAWEGDELVSSISRVTKREKLLREKIFSLQQLKDNTAAMNRIAVLSEELTEVMQEKGALFDLLAAQQLRGVVFDAQHSSVVDGLADILVKRGAIRFGTTVMCGKDDSSSSLPLPHPYHPAIQVGGNSGSGSLAVALGLSTFSLVANGGGSSRISAGLFGLSTFYHPAVDGVSSNPTRQDGFRAPSVGVISRTPLDNALLTRIKHKRLFQVMDDHDQPLDSDVRIAYLSNFAAEQHLVDDSTMTFPAFHKDIPLPTKLHESVEDAMTVAIRKLTDSRVRLTSLDNKIAEISHTFFAGWMKSAETLAGEELVTRDPYGVLRSDISTSAAIRQAANAWKQHKLHTTLKEGVDINNHAVEKMKQQHRRDALKYTEQYLLTPLLRLPYWKTAGPNKKKSNTCEEEPTYTCENTNPAVPFFPTCKGVGPNGEALDVLDPTFNPYCILANVWQTPSVTIPFSIKAPHPVRRGASVTLPYALLLTAMPGHYDTMKANPTDSLMDILFVAHKISLHLRDYNCPPPYIKELWALSREPDEHERVTWPTDFEA